MEKKLMMQRQRENVYAAHKSSEEEDIDFNDVFGGPPRRFSMQEVSVRYSFGESDEDKASSPWSSKPVFGEGSGARRRNHHHDFFGRDSLLCSRIMSPVQAEPFSTSLPAQFSLPAKLTKAMELPTYNHSQHKTDASTNGLNSPRSSNSLSRFSSRAIRGGQDEIKNELHPSPLSHQTSLSNEELPPYQRDNVVNLKKDAKSVDGIDNQFHFSIYKWAGRGVPMLMPLVLKNNLQSKDISASSDEKIVTDHMEPESLNIQLEKKEEERREVQHSFEEALYDTPGRKSRSSAKDSVIAGGHMKGERVKSAEIREKNVREVPVKAGGSRKSKTKPLHAFLSEKVVEQQGNDTEMKRNKTRAAKGVLTNKQDGKNAKKNEDTEFNSSTVTIEKKPSFPGAASKSGVKGKVREFVQIFNQEADVQTRTQSFRWKAVGVSQKEGEEEKTKENVNLEDIDKKPQVSLKVDESINKDEAQNTVRFHNFSADQKNAFHSESVERDPNISVENTDDHFDDNFLVQELAADHEKVTQGEDSEDLKAIDTKIHQWSFGKKGNIRSLLSTLQYVLWPGSGWKPVPLVDLIEANSVKRAYQKALLRLHPDKLQQKGAAFQHKYIAEKVFDILQEAWEHFNTLAPL